MTEKYFFDTDCLSAFLWVREESILAKLYAGRIILPAQVYCEVHKLQHPEEVRSAAGRGYGRAWQKARKRYLESHPFCVQCMKEGKYVKATDVDHIVPHRGDKKLFWDEGNWQALCHRHHSIKTRNEDHNPEYRY